MALTDSFVRELKRYAILALAIVILQGWVSSFIVKYVSFLTGFGSIGTYIINFLALLIIIIPVDMITQRTI
jgi:hypothetical protein